MIACVPKFEALKLVHRGRPASSLGAWFAKQVELDRERSGATLATLCAVYNLTFEAIDLGDRLLALKDDTMNLDPEVRVLSVGPLYYTVSYVSGTRQFCIK